MIERYRTHADYCATPGYQQWLAKWEPPAGEINWVDSEHDWYHDLTPRHQMQERHGTRLAYHLLDTLDRGSAPCVDIGCGHNPHPGLWGVDPHNERHRDELLTPEWYVHNRGQWAHAFTCNAMHFCVQDEVLNQIAKVRGILRPQGTAVIAINRARIQDANPTKYDAQQLFQDLEALPGLTRGVWMKQPRNAYMDGNVWLWLTQ